MQATVLPAPVAGAANLAGSMLLPGTAGPEQDRLRGNRGRSRHQEPDRVTEQGAGGRCLSGEEPGAGADGPAEASPLRDEFYTRVTGKSAAQAKSVWARLAFTGKAKPPKEAPNGGELKKLLAATPNAIGYIDKTELDSSVKVLFSVQ